MTDKKIKLSIIIIIIVAITLIYLTPVNTPHRWSTSTEILDDLMLTKYHMGYIQGYQDALNGKQPDTLTDEQINKMKNGLGEASTKHSVERSQKKVMNQLDKDTLKCEIK